MIRLITATPGSGKTCIVVEWLLREIERGFYHEYYTNIENLTICGVRKLPNDCDWRKLNPEKSEDEPPKLIIIDECQYISAFMKENRSVHNAIGKDLSTHRHYGIDIWLITQSTKLLNDYVLENVGEHVHLFRPRRSKTVQVFWWSYVQKSLTKSAFKDADDKQYWRLNPLVFKYYKSTSNVTDSKARTSQKVVMSIISFIIIAIVLLFFVIRGIEAYTKMQATDDTIIEKNHAIQNDTIIESDEIFNLTGYENQDEHEHQDIKKQEKEFVRNDDENSLAYYYTNTSHSNDHQQHQSHQHQRYNDYYVSSSLPETSSIYVYNVDTQDCTVKNEQSTVISTDQEQCKNKFHFSD